MVQKSSDGGAVLVLSFGFVSRARWHGCAAEGPTAAEQPSGVTEEQPYRCCPSVTAYL